MARKIASAEKSEFDPPIPSGAKVVRTWYEVEFEGRVTQFPTLERARVHKLIHGGTIYEMVETR